MDRLVEKLLLGKHPILFEPQTEEFTEIKQRLKEGLVFVKFIDTQGGTELGLKVDNQLSRWEKADFEIGKGSLQLVGACELNFQKVRCVADIDLATRQGTGHLELLNS